MPIAFTDLPFYPALQPRSSPFSFFNPSNPIIFKNRLRGEVQCQLISRKREGSAEIAYPNYYHLVTVFRWKQQGAGFSKFGKDMLIKVKRIQESLPLSSAPWHVFRIQSGCLEKGKPFERMGRKATGLNPGFRDTAAGLPGEVSTSLRLKLAWPLFENFNRGGAVTYGPHLCCPFDSKEVTCPSCLILFPLPSLFCYSKRPIKVTGILKADADRRGCQWDLGTKG